MTHPSVKNIISLYQKHGLTWAEKRHQHKPERMWFDRFITLLTGNTLLDFGCGTGIPVARHFIEQGYAVQSVDSAPKMTEQCPQNFPEQQ